MALQPLLIFEQSKELLRHAIRLEGYDHAAFLADGVPEEQIHDSAICTYTQHEDFFSARRLGIRSGRILNGIVVKSDY